MIDNSDIPLPLNQLRCRVLVFAIIDEAIQQYEQITKGYVQLTTDIDGKSQTICSLEVKDQKTNELLMRSNLTIEKNFGKQKGSIISWTDQEQPQYSQLALSFQKDNQCDQFWRTICQKVGKSYLQICGQQKLDIINSENLSYFLQKAKNNIDLVDYNIVHSKSILQILRKIFQQMKIHNNEMGIGTLSRIINAIMSPSYSLNSIQALLTGQYFFMLLDLQEFKKNIKFRQIYYKKIGNLLINKFNLPKQIFQKIQLSHRAIFYRQNVLQLSEDGQLQSMMLMISKQAIIEIISYLNRQRLLQKIISQKTNKLIVIQDKINFIFEALIIYQQISSQQIKIKFKENLFIVQVFQFIKQQIQMNNNKIIQILFYIVQIDPQKFMIYLVQNFKSNSTDNFLKTLMKKYIHQQNMRKSILSLIESLIILFNQKKENLQFFNGTFVYSVFSIAKNSLSIISLTNLLISQLVNNSKILNYLIQFKIFNKFALEYRNGTGLKNKSEELQMIKLLKYIIIEQNIKKQTKNKQILQNIINSGYFDCCMLILFKYSLKNNIISSSMLQNLKIISQSDFSKLDQYLIKEYSSNQSFQVQKIIKIIKIKYIDFMNKNKQIQKLNEYLQIQKINHQNVLENQIQDLYLMNDQNTQQTQQLIDHLNNYKQSIIKLNQNQSISQEKEKQIYLEKLRRMLNQVSQKEEESIIIKIPKKYVKKNQNNQQNCIQFKFDLPDINQLESNDCT